MPLVDIEKVEKEAAKKKDAIQEIVSKSVGGKTYFWGKILGEGKCFDDYGECVRENEKEKNRVKMAGLGLNEWGQTPEQVEISEKRHELFKKKAELLKKVSDIDAEIGALSNKQAVKEPKKKK